MCSAALREWVRVVKDQIGERSVVIIVLKKESTIWRKGKHENLAKRVKQLKDINIEEMRVVTNDRHVAEEIKRDKVESVVTNVSKVGEVGKVGREQCEERRDQWSQKWRSWKIGKLQN